MTSIPSRDSGIRTIPETPADLEIPVLLNRDWAPGHDWLVQGTTWRGPEGDFDLGLFGTVPVGVSVDRWRQVRTALGFRGCVHSRQVHGTRILTHRSGIEGLLIAEGADGHRTEAADLLLTVSTADCIPIAVADPARRRVAMMHAGWRGVAGGAVEAVVAAMLTGTTRPSDLICHLGPAICGNCYEVGPEVHEQLGLPRPSSNRPVDLREIAARRLIAAGMPPSAVSTSPRCPRCDPDRFFSHRAGSSGRQVGFIGIRPDRSA